MPFLECKNLSKMFGNVAAVSGVDIQVEKGEVVGLLGDNGAGKSTLIGMIAGIYRPDSGTILINGREVEKWDVPTARAMGIETVFQDRALVEQQSVSTNIFMGREIRGTLGFVNLKRQKGASAKLLRDIGLTSKLITPGTSVLTLSGGERQGVSIARALYFKAEIVIMDEPTTALSLTESEKVFDFIRRIKREGLSCIFISHNIYHSYDVSDRFVVMDRGKLAYTCSKLETTAELLIKHMQRLAKGEGAAQ